MRTESDNEALKNEVREYWNANPCGTQFTDLEWGSRAFFDEVERFRYEVQPFMRRLMEFDNFRGQRLLEVGCGLGTDLLQFARGGAAVTGVDLTPSSIELVKKRFALYGLPVEAQVADAEHLPFTDGTFDAVYSFGVLHHTPNTPRSVSEVFRVLKPGGRAIVMLYHRHSWHAALGKIYSRFSKRFRAVASTDEWIRIFDGAGNPLGKAYTRNECRAMFAAFADIRFTVADPLRRTFPQWLNGLNQRIFGPWCGFYLVIKATK